MTTFDPRREIEKLRSHLASHDKPIVFLIGAGASCAVEGTDGAQLIPAIGDLGNRCRDAVHKLGGDYVTAWASIVAEIESRRPCNIEEILSSVRRKIAAVGPGDRLAGLDHDELMRFEGAIRRSIAEAATPAEVRVPVALPQHHQLARWIRRTDRSVPVEIFTTNYDTLLERGLEDERVAHFDGFVGSRRPFFLGASLEHDSFAPGSRWARLWKVHGSVNWSWDGRDDVRRRIVRGSEGVDGELILPSSHKYDESRKQPYTAMLERLKRVLLEREDVLLVTIGYSFGDDHINAVVFDALGIKDRLHVVSLQFGDVAEDHVLHVEAERHKNLLVYGRSRAIVGGEPGRWLLHEPVDRAMAGLLDIPFDSDGSESLEEEAMLTGAFRLGDFVWFGAFLESFARSHGE